MWVQGPSCSHQNRAVAWECHQPGICVGWRGWGEQREGAYDGVSSHGLVLQHCLLLTMWPQRQLATMPQPLYLPKKKKVRLICVISKIVFRLLETGPFNSLGFYEIKWKYLSIWAKEEAEGTLVSVSLGQTPLSIPPSPHAEIPPAKQLTDVLKSLLQYFWW